MSVALRLPIPDASPPPRSRRAHLRAVPASCPVPPPAALLPRGAAVRTLHPPVDRGPAAPVRLTRRGVVVVSALVAAVCAGLLALAAWSAASTGTGAASGRGTPSAVIVRPGDTLWSIALRTAPSVDPRAEVALLQQLNHLRGERLVPGERLRVR